MHTRITELFGIEYPIVCGGMFRLCEPGLCAAVSNAGALGNITAAAYDDPEDLRAAIRDVRRATDKPFSVNITMLPSRITENQYAGYYRVCCEERIAVIEASGKPVDDYIDQVHAAGIKIMHKVGAVRHALHAQRAGYDALLVAGVEEGGHPLSDDVATMVLTPRVADSVEIPVITAGGIADGRGLVAAMALGADGVMMATRFAVTKECILPESIKDYFVAKKENETSLICKTTGLQARALNNALTEKVIELEEAGGGLDSFRDLISGRRMASALQSGNAEEAVWNMGQSIGLIDDIPTCAELVSHMVDDARTAASSMTRSFGGAAGPADFKF